MTSPSSEQSSVLGSGLGTAGLAYSTGRERFLVAEEGMKPDHLAVADVDHPAGLLVELDAAAAAAEVHLPEHHDLVAVLMEDLGLDLPEVEALLHGVRPFAVS